MSLAVSAQLQVLLEEIVSLARSLKEPDQFGVARRTILQTLAELGPLTVPHLARLVRTSRQNIQMLVDRLDRNGWVEGFENPVHKRSRLYRLTSKGAGALVTAKREDGQKFAGLDLSENDIQAALEVLNRIGRRLGVARRPEAPRRKTIAVARRAPAPVPAAPPRLLEITAPVFEAEELPYNLL